jgi:hypothetical protein
MTSVHSLSAQPHAQPCAQPLCTASVHDLSAQPHAQPPSQPPCTALCIASSTASSTGCRYSLLDSLSHQWFIGLSDSLASLNHWFHWLISSIWLTDPIWLTNLLIWLLSLIWLISIGLDNILQTHLPFLDSYSNSGNPEFEILKTYINPPLFPPRGRALSHPNHHHLPHFPSDQLWSLTFAAAIYQCSSYHSNPFSCTLSLRPCSSDTWDLWLAS